VPGKASVIRTAAIHGGSSDHERHQKVTCPIEKGKDALLTGQDISSGFGNITMLGVCLKRY